MAALIDASTGYNVISDYGSDIIENPHVPLDDAATGPQSEDDLFDTNTGLDYLSSGSSLLNPKLLVSVQADLLGPQGDFRNIYIKSFEDQTAPRLTLAGALSAIAFIITVALTFAANLLLQAQLLKLFPSLMLALVSFQGLARKQTGKFRTGTLSFSAAVQKKKATILAGALSFIGSFSSLVVTIYHQAVSGALSFVGTFVRQRGRIFPASLAFSGRIIRFTSKIRTGALSFVGFSRISRAVSFLANLSFTGVWIRFRGRTFSAILSFASTFRTLKDGLVRLQLQSALAFSVLSRKATSRFFSSFASFNFTPKQIPGLFMWLSAEKLQLNDGDLVNIWPDLSGRSFDATASGTARPTFRTGVLNGRPVVRFDGVANAMTTVPANLLQPDTLICVGKQNSTATYGAWFNGSGVFGQNAQMMANSWSNGVFFINADNTAQEPIDHSGAFHIYTGIFSGLAGSFFGSGFVDGVSAWTPQNVGSSNFEDVMQFGHIQNLSGPPFYMDGDIAELIAYSHALTDSELKLIHSYLGVKYGIPLAVTTDVSLAKRTNRLLSAISSFAAVLNITPFTALIQKSLASVLSFVGDFRKFTPFLRLQSVLSFIGVPQKKLPPKSFAVTLSFIGNFSKQRVKILTGTVSWIGNLARKFNNTFLIFLQSTLRFRPSFRRPFGNLVALFNAMITTVGQTILGVSREDHDSLSVSNTEQTISNSPTVLDTVNAPLGVLFVKNLDTQATVEVDSVSSFDKFPQLIPPESGVYLSPDVASTIYAQSSAVTSDVQIISLRRSPPRLINLSSTINFTGSLSS